MHTRDGSGNAVDVLIADDDPMLRTGMRMLLEREGYSCAEAEQGAQAMEVVRRRKPRCVFLDLAMPTMDGFTVARLLRADPRTHDVHLNCLTGLGDRRAREQALLAGCEHFLTKPLDANALLDVVRRQVERRTEKVAGLTKEQAERLLDWLEAHACAALEVLLLKDGFTVSWLAQHKEGRPAGRIPATEW